MPRWKWFQRSNEPVDVVQRPITNERPRVADEIGNRNGEAQVLPMVRPAANKASQVRSGRSQKRPNGGGS
ncbi:hypothetical protein O7602_04810 [Micromonospora sp. WMMD1128]|uniref:hypothetical protein n=1 Tax=Micromonospora sp. WMMD1128 TaxID=3015150 RepID=UPI00248C8A08|nr:hypothetical protein [Micromonospora sp. WMMD1128]WBB74870.1 hypothetical protein O7602_04810 [Micromonospora sp. WMMD1128]